MNKLAFASIALISVLSASADLTTQRLAPVAAYAPNSSSKTIPTYVINGSGFNETAGTHGTSNGNNDSVWRSGSADWFVMDLGSLYNVADVKIWNYNGSSYTNRGLKQIDILFSVEDDAYSAGVDFSNGKWVEVVADHELAQAPGTDSYAGADPIVLATPKNARFIGIRIDSNHGGSERGLSEIRIDVVRSVSMESVVAAAGSATVSGTLASVNSGDGEVFLAYGEANGGHDLQVWDEVVSCGTFSPGDTVSKEIGNLVADKSYFAKFYVYDASRTNNWSATTNFITGVVSVTMPPAFCEAETAKKHVVFSRPASCAAETLEVKYVLSGDAAADYADALPGIVVFAAGATEAAVEFTPTKGDATVTTDKTLTVTVLPGLYVTDTTSSGSVTVLDTSSVTAHNPSWTGNANTMDWDTAGNWSPTILPNYLDAVTINGASSVESPVVLSAYDHTVKSIALGSLAGDFGALSVPSGKSFVATDGIRVGENGDGWLSVDGTFQSPNGNISIGSYAGAKGIVEVDGNVTVEGKSGRIYVGSKGEGLFHMKGGKVYLPSNSYGDFIVGDSSGSAGCLVVDGGLIDINHAFVVGNSGNGVYTNNAGSVTGYKGSSFAKVAGSSADICINGGSVSISGSELVVGEAGRAMMTINNGGLAHGRGISIGSADTADGCVKVNEGGILRSGENYTISVGVSGRGVILMRGGSVARGSSANKFRVRAAQSGYGLVSGWGSITLNSAQDSYLMNNGLIIADGRADDGTSAERSLTMNVQQNPFQNTIENDSTNGWYAVNKGLLSVAHPTFSLDVGDSGVCTWGEAESDDKIDLVNSARVTFTNITTKISAFTGKLYAADRSDVPLLPGAGEAAGVWKFDITGAYESAEVEFRYDHVKAPRGVQMYQRNADDTAWIKLRTTLLEGYRAKVAVTDASRMFAARANAGRFIITVR